MFRRVLFIPALVLSVSGCSLLFVDGPPQVRPGAEAPTMSSCTAEMTLPTLDLVFGALNGLGGAVLLAGGDETMTEEESNQLGVWGLVWGGVLLVSGTSGRGKVNGCRDFLATPVQPAPWTSPPPKSIVPNTTLPLWSPETGWRDLSRARTGGR